MLLSTIDGVIAIAETVKRCFVFVPLRGKSKLEPHPQTIFGILSKLKIIYVTFIPPPTPTLWDANESVTTKNVYFLEGRTRHFKVGHGQRRGIRQK